MQEEEITVLPEVEVDGREAEDTSEEELYNRERAMRTIQAQRESEKKLAAELKEAKKALKAYQDEDQKRKEADLSEIERAKKRILELEGSLTEAQTYAQSLRLQSAFRRVANTLELSFAGEQAIEDAFELADLSGVEIDENGKVTGLEAALKALQKDRPYLFASGDGTPSIGTPKRPKVPSSNGTRGQVGPVKIRF